jgi:hypothetical protein
MDGSIGNDESERMDIEGEDSEATGKGIEYNEYESIGVNVDECKEAFSPTAAASIKISTLSSNEHLIRALVSVWLIP